MKGNKQKEIEKLKKLLTNKHVSDAMKKQAEKKIKELEGEDSKPNFADWEGKVTDHISEIDGMTTSDAQGFMDVNTFRVNQAWGKGLNPKEAAEFILEKEGKSEKGSGKITMKEANERMFKKYKANFPKPGEIIKFRGKDMKVFSINKAGVEFGDPDSNEPTLSTALYGFVKEYFHGFEKVKVGDKWMYKGSPKNAIGKTETKTIDEWLKDEDFSIAPKGKGLKALLPDEPKKSDLPDCDELLEKAKKQKAQRKKAAKKAANSDTGDVVKRAAERAKKRVKKEGGKVTARESDKIEDAIEKLITIIKNDKQAIKNLIAKLKKLV